jgi:hypothetical protein
MCILALLRSLGESAKRPVSVNFHKNAYTELDRFSLHFMKCFAFCFLVLGFVSLTIRETLTFRAFERERRTFPVFHLAGVPFEIPFAQVTS